MNLLFRTGTACVLLLLAACATQAPSSSVMTEIPAQWHSPLPDGAQAMGTPLPHNGALTDLSQWWQQQGDPLLVQMIDAAQTVSPSVASAKSRIEQSRTARVAAGAALLPVLDASASVARSNAQPPLPMGTTTQAALQPSWEIDLFGGNSATRDAAQARLEGAAAGWHEARVAVAAEVANQYYSLRACENLLAIAISDAASRAETARLSELSMNAGFAAPATTALARASAAESNARATQQRALCALDIKALVALTAMPESDLRTRIADASNAAASSAATATIAVPSLPAQLLAQRPDVFAAEREVAAASADVGSAQAQRYPKLSLSGSIGAARFHTGGTNTDLPTWSIGPLALSVPLFDAGRRAANVDSARARYEEAAINYHASIRKAVREVEEALVALQSTAARSDDARIAAEGYRTSFNATESRYKNGLTSLVELEDSRRVRLAAENGLVTLERERRTAWVALYRALGGGWTPDATPVPARAAAPASVSAQR
jgi:multidrug efflux system outer membrane protein